MKLKKIITIGLLLFLIGTNVPLTANAQEAEETVPEKECKGEIYDFTKLYSDFIDQMMNNEISITQKTMKSAFIEAQTQYHNYVECIFDYTEQRFISKMEEWNDPDQACIGQNDLIKMIQETDPTQMLPPMLKAHKEYGEHLDSLVSLYDTTGEQEEIGGETMTITEKLQLSTSVSKEFKRQVQSEKENAMVAIDITFSTLKELRMSFVMHVHFQCIIQSLQKYGSVLAKVRSIVETLPERVEDASMTK